MIDYDFTPILDSDFDGTAVVKCGKLNWRNSTKYPLPEMPRYHQFLDGFRERGGKTGNIITVRKEWLRSAATRRSISNLGLTEYFNPDQDITYAGTEDDKAQAIVDRIGRAYGFLEDNPQKLVPRVAALMAEVEIPRKVITIGAVNHPDSQERVSEAISRTLDTVRKSEINYMNSVSTTIDIGRSAVHIVELDDYSFESGKRFADMVEMGIY